ncbi:MAG TPA: DUF1294 domain-containing protein [Novimethylophilus sp.]|jgi:uncharacterized membrane protein YsdA (DUF1294 family)|uniref:DUF1294 domain-containing protein n=1 Tax=Novimethylophilus sp. TaxID=2137426 RepID=UPI002F422184
MTARLITPSSGAILFLVLIAGAVLAGKLPSAVLTVYLTASLIAFIAYACDKSAARNRQRCTPERTLHLLALLGGWPGALVAQQRLRHKSKKVSFLVVFWGAVVINCGVLEWWLR